MKKINSEIDNTKLLHDVYKNLDMATWCIDIVDDEISDDNMLNLIKKQKKYYEKQKCKCLELSEKYDIDLKNINVMTKISCLTNIKITTLMDNTDSKLSNKLLQGTSNGIIQIKKALNNYKKADGEILDIAKNLYDNEKIFYDSLQFFL